MIFAPFKNVETLNGLIHKYHIDYTVETSSTHVDAKRKTNPFTSSDDRWCSESREHAGEWLMINFTRRSLYISHFVLWNKKNDNDPISWYAEGCNKNSCYNLTVYENTSIGEKEVFETNVHGPFDSFRYVSTGKSSSSSYHHCASKLDFYGATSDSIKRKCTQKLNNSFIDKLLLLMIVAMAKK